MLQNACMQVCITTLGEAHGLREVTLTPNHKDPTVGKM